MLRNTLLARKWFNGDAILLLDALELILVLLELMLELHQFSPLLAINFFLRRHVVRDLRHLLEALRIDQLLERLFRSLHRRKPIGRVEITLMWLVDRNADLCKQRFSVMVEA